MGTCGHQYLESHPPCPHATVDGADRCLWHDPKVRKDDAYIPALLVAADRQADGGLDGFQLVGLHWPEAPLAGRSLRLADLRDAVMDVADCSGADLSGANLRRASFKRANLQRACLTGADLSGCNLTGADLREADLTQAILSQTVLNGADLRGANLTGARIAGFLWNAATRFQGIRGVAEPVLASEDDETRACWSPMAAGALAGEDEQVYSRLDEPDPVRDATRSFAAIAPIVAPLRRSAPRRERLYLAFACTSLIVAGIGVAIGLTPQTVVEPAPLSAELDQERQQSAAYLARLQVLESELAEIATVRDEGHREASIARTEAALMSDLLRQARNEAARLREADDRVSLAATRIAALTAERDELVVALQRQARLGTILADGTRRLEAQTQVQAQQLTELTQAAARAEQLAHELALVKSTTKRDVAAREDAVARVEVLTRELAATRDDLERYLGRVTGTAWQDLLADDGVRSPFIPIVAGHTVALGGAYALTVRVEAGTRPNMVATAVTVQRPLGAADPDVALLLYDRDHRILRRLAFGFPSLDERAPVTAAHAEIACPQFPAYMRILVAPTISTAAR